MVQKAEKNSGSTILPLIFLANVQSFGSSSRTDKTTECELILNTNHIDISVFTETWLSDATKDQLSFNNYIQFYLVCQNTL